MSKEEQITKIQKELKKQQDEMKYMDANIKINYILPIITILVFLLTKLYGNLHIYSFIITPFVAATLTSLFLIVFFIKELIFAIKFISKRFLNVLP